MSANAAASFTDTLRRAHLLEPAQLDELTRTLATQPTEPCVLAEAGGERAGPPGSLKNWEQGRRLPQLDAAYRLARAVGVSLDELAGQVFEEGAPAKSDGRAEGKPAPKRRVGRGRKGG
jgi:transcriptional regulator with XRE-family HTH domain